jgi:methionine-rich copper-binding protein CopC
MVSRSLANPSEWVRRLLCAGLALSFGVVLLVALPAPKAAAAPCDAPVNEIACENTQTGTPSSEWQISGSGSASLQGFATDISVNRGSTIGFKVKTTSTSYHLDIYRMGYYGGAGARKVATVNPTTFPTQPACLNQSSTGLKDCGNWAQTASWAVPITAVSGIYFAHVVTTSGSAESHIVFIVRDDTSHSNLFFQTSDTTWQAYNDYGGNSLYEGSPAGRAYKVSYNRPFDTNAETPEDFVWNSEYPMVRFLEANGYDVSYTTGVDTERFGNLIKNHKTFLSVGHDEYWSGGQRANVEAARAAGVNLAFFSGNEVFWKTRWENSISAGSASHRTLVSYKETHANAKIDPTPAWTGTWRDPRFSPPADGGRPENGLTGTIFMVNCCTTDMEVDGVDGQMRFWRNTRVANLNSGQSTTLGSGILGYEWDESPDNGSQPAGLIRLSTTTRTGVDRLQDYGSTYAPGSATHHLSMYRASSGALVFGAGTVQWAWGLDNNHSGGSGNTSDDAVRQATVNLFADMGVQPATLQSGLSAASASSDTTAPTSTITAPAAGATVPVGQPLTVTGTATDAGGGKVGGVEVSTDDGTSWHPATGRGSWSYTFTPGSNGTLTLRTRATDDSLRTETPSAGRTITVGTGTPPPPGSCPCTIWPSTATPAVAADPDTTAIEVGVKFRANQAGFISGIRFYKGSANTGTHVGSLWSGTGTKLGSATFTGESASGWQQVNFGSPVAVAANTTYVASYYAPNGRYATSDGYFTTPTSNGPLTALQDGADGVNGVYRYGSTGFPNLGYAASNYWVDVVYDTSSSDTTKPTLTDKQPASGATGIATSTDVTATFSEPVTPSTIAMALRDSNDTAVSGSTVYDSSTRRATFTPSAALKDSETYTATVSGAKDAAGNTMDSVSWSFTTAAAPPADTTPPTITARTPASGATGVATSTAVTATFSEALQPGTTNMTLSGPGGSVSGAVDYDSANRKATFTPNAALTASTTYTVNVSGAKDIAGNTMTAVSWTFTTAAASSSCPCTIWPSSATPAVAADPDTGGVEVGVKFRTTQAGTVTGIRFYKGSGNSGTHAGSLWSSTGTKLAGVTFTGESPAGWQEATFATPVSVAANTTYVASYYAPAGHYSVSENYFTSPTTRGPLTALQNSATEPNGVYKYGGASGFPTTGYQSSNYWVDVVLTTN